MAKDFIGNIIKTGQKLLFNNIVYTVQSIDENRVIGGTQITAKGIKGMRIPDSITLSCDLPFDANQAFNGFVLQDPEAGNKADA